MTYDSVKNSYLKSYIIYNSPSCVYVAFSINPYYEMTSVYVKATVASFDEYDLISGLSKYLNLSTLNTYKFYISA